MDNNLAYILLSIKPQFAEFILAGRKTVELRKLFSIDSAGKKMFLYSTKPRQAIVGAVDIKEVRILPVEEIRVNFLDKCCINNNQLVDYFRSKKNGYVIILDNPIRFKTTISLKELRMKHFSPPQSYKIIDASNNLFEILKKLYEVNQNENNSPSNNLFEM